MSNITAKLILTKQSSNKLNDSILSKHVKEISESTKNRTSASGVQCVAEKVDVQESKAGSVYTFMLNMGRAVTRSENVANKAMIEGKKFVMRAAELRGWAVKDSVEAAQIQAVADDRPKFEVPELCENVLKEKFGGIFERDSHIRIIHDAVTNAINTSFNERDHVVLFGPPAVAKSILFKRFKKFYEGEGDIERVALINSVTLSKAGLETWILERAKDKVLPDILCFDEIEKFNMDNLQCLLGLMDDGGVISRTNAKIGRQSAEAKVLIWATCNDENRLKEFASGALWSRFTKRLGCGRPKRELMRDILVNSLQSRLDDGEDVKLEWADAAINYAFDVMKTNDPREVKGLLSGRDRLLDGSYMRDLEAINKSYQESVSV